MPTLPPKFPAVVARQRARERDYDRQRQPNHRFYCSARWLKLRSIKLARDPLCEECECKGETTPATEVDHTIPRQDRPDLELDIRNLRSMCKSHHSRKTRQEQLARRGSQSSDRSAAA
jgi:5-methylcytosine-specific restriction enzyme A